MIKPIQGDRDLQDRRWIQRIGALLLFGSLFVMLTVAIQMFVTSRVQFGADFHTFWIAAKAMFLEGISPFAPQVTLRTQLGIYGRPPLPGEDPLGFAYPPYSLFVVLPTIWMSYPWAQAFWIALNVTALMGALYYAFPGLPRWVFATVVFFYPAGYGMIIGNFAVLIGIICIIVYALLRPGQRTSTGVQITAGILLAWVTIKPQISWLLIGYFLLYGVRDRLWGLLAGFGTAMLTFAGVSFWMVPGWPAEWLQQVLSNADELRFFEPLAITYAGWVSPQGIKPWVGLLIVILCGGMSARLLVGWWRQQERPFLVLAWLVLFIQLVHPLILSPDQVIILLPLLLWIWQGGTTQWATRNVVWAIALIAPWLFFFFPIVVLQSYETTMIVVTKGPPFLFALWAIWTLLQRTVDRPGHTSVPASISGQR